MLLCHLRIEHIKIVLLTPTHLVIVMEYAASGELFEGICIAGRFGEDEARFFFQQLISGVSYCQSMQICHRDDSVYNGQFDDGNDHSDLKDLSTLVSLSPAGTSILIFVSFARFSY